MKQVFTALSAQLEAKEACVLATIIGERGSSPRGMGARMLVGKEGRIAGTVGGGAIEYRATQMAAELLAAGTSLCHDFNLRANDKDQLGMTCGGTVTMALQYVSPENALWQAAANRVQQAFEAHQPVWLAIDRDNISAPLQVLEMRGMLPGTDCVLNGKLPVCAGTWYAEPLLPNPRVVIFGGGHIAEKLVKILPDLDFRPWVFEDRPEYADPARLPEAEQVLLGDYTKISETLVLSADDFVVVMTNAHSHDCEVQGQVMAAEHAYLGVIGSRAKIANINKKLLEQGFTQDDLDKVYTPIGVSIGAVTPAEIAISIAGELIQVRASLRGDAGSAACPMH